MACLCLVSEPRTVFALYKRAVTVSLGSSAVCKEPSELHMKEPSMKLQRAYKRSIMKFSQGIKKDITAAWLDNSTNHDACD